MACPYLTPLPSVPHFYKPGEVIYRGYREDIEDYVSDEPSPPLTAENFYDNIEEVE